jgi:hypothetical protein
MGKGEWERRVGKECGKGVWERSVGEGEGGRGRHGWEADACTRNGGPFLLTSPSFSPCFLLCFTTFVSGLLASSLLPFRPEANLPDLQPRFRTQHARQAGNLHFGKGAESVCVGGGRGAGGEGARPRCVCGGVYKCVGGGGGGVGGRLQERKEIWGRRGKGRRSEVEAGRGSRPTNSCSFLLLTHLSCMLPFLLLFFPRSTELHRAHSLHHNRQAAPPSHWGAGDHPREAHECRGPAESHTQHELHRGACMCLSA